MHGRDLKVSSATLAMQNGEALDLIYEQQTPDGVVKISLPMDVEAQRATLSIVYEAPLGKELSGLYKVVENHVSYAYTQFEPIAARECFPGFDEPRFKTPFTLTISLPQEDTAYANTPLVRQEVSDKGNKVFYFAPSKPLPTYLVAFGVGPFDVVEAQSLAPNGVRKDPIPFRAIAKKGSGSKLQYAIKHTPKIVEILENYFQSPYPYEKLDIIAVPDFAAGAMENAGAITFRDWLLLVDGKSPPVSQKRRFAEVMAHELAHQWFGNLVTMTWWNDLWLNEAFATWMGFRVVNEYQPTFNANIDLLGESQHAMRQDSLVSARQIRQPIQSHHDIHNAFDSITYSKGGAVLSMFEKYLGAETFRKGIQRHLERFPFQTATSEDFVASLSEVAGQDIREPFFSFLTQAGVPLLKMQHTCDKGLSRLHLEQSRYLPLASKGSADASWQIPFCYKYKVKGQIKESCSLIKDRSTDIEFRNSTCPAWILPNAQASGYYRFELDSPALKSLVKAAKTDLSEREQLALIDSIKAGFARGSLKASEVYGLLKPFSSSKSRYVALEPLDLLRFSKDYLLSDKHLPGFEKFTDTLYKSTATNMNSSHARGVDSDEAQLFQRDLYDFMAFTDRDPQIRSMLFKKGQGYLRSLTDVSDQSKPIANSELAGIALGVVVQKRPEIFKALMAKLEGVGDPIKRYIILSALGKSGQELDPDAYALLLGTTLRRNEVFHFLGSYLEQSKNADTVWNWFKAHYEEVIYALPKKQLGSIPSLASRFCSNEKADEVKEFFQGKIDQFPGGPRHLDQVLEHISLCAGLVENQKKDAENFFEKRVF
jgi:alanyl aminopeptidase